MSIKSARSMCAQSAAEPGTAGPSGRADVTIPVVDRDPAPPGAADVVAVRLARGGLCARRDRRPPLVWDLPACGGVLACPPRRLAGWRARPGGFTLIELLTVVAVISLLVAMLMPSLSRAREIARRAKCAMNQRSILLGATLYAASENSYPYIELDGGTWGVPIGTNRGLAVAGGGAAPMGLDLMRNDRTGQSRSPTGTLYLLIRGSYAAPGHFVCPSTDEQEDDTGDFWDFADGTRVSYSLMNPYGPERYFTNGAQEVPLLADQSPYFDPATGLRNAAGTVDLSGNPDADAIAAGNSPNHGTDGQNAAVVGGSVRFVRRADVGADRDNIYTRAEELDGTDAAGDIPATGGGSGEPDQGPAGPRDSYLVP